mgnify:CR=1 FL=1
MDFTVNLELSPLEIALSGASYLASLVNDNGRFKYRFDPEAGTDAGGYNVLRHCGTIWAMMDVYETGEADEEVLAACKRAAIHLQNEFLKLFRAQENLCILEGNAIKLGGNALAILALLSVDKTAKDSLLQGAIIRLGDFMLALQQPDGDFIHKQYFRSGKVSSFRSMYYTGEALLALLKLHQACGEKRFLDAVIKCENSLYPQDYGVKEHSHWMLYSLESLSRLKKKKEHYLHARKIAQHILDHPDYRDWGRSTPIACRSEGLLAFLRSAPPTAALKKSGADAELRRLCLQRVKEDLALQLQSRRPEGSFIRGGGDRRHNEVRIDYIQHNISSFLHYHRMTE